MKLEVTGEAVFLGVRYLKYVIQAWVGLQRAK